MIYGYFRVIREYQQLREYTLREIHNLKVFGIKRLRIMAKFTKESYNEVITTNKVIRNLVQRV